MFLYPSAEFNLSKVVTLGLSVQYMEGRLMAWQDLKQAFSKILFYHTFLQKARETFYQIMHGN